MRNSLHANNWPAGMGPGRRLVGGLASAAAICSAALWLALSSASGATASDIKTFGFTGGEELFTVPAGVTGLHVVAVAGRGGTGGVGLGELASGGFGARVTADLPVVPGQTLFVDVGDNGLARSTSAGSTTNAFNGGGSGAQYAAGGGGGATDIRTISRAAASGTLNSRLIIAGGGGGAGGDSFPPTGPATAGGAGGQAGAPGLTGNGSNAGNGAGTVSWNLTDLRRRAPTFASTSSGVSNLFASWNTQSMSSRYWRTSLDFTVPSLINQRLKFIDMRDRG